MVVYIKLYVWITKRQIMTIVQSAAFGSSIFLVAFDIIPPLSITSLVVTM